MPQSAKTELKRVEVSYAELAAKLKISESGLYKKLRAYGLG